MSETPKCIDCGGEPQGFAVISTAEPSEVAIRYVRLLCHSCKEKRTGVEHMIPFTMGKGENSAGEKYAIIKGHVLDYYNRPQ